MSSTEVYDKLTWYEKLAINVARSAPVPRHIAYIMDGNRRFAEKIKIPTEAGIAFGFERFVKVMNWSSVLGVKVITVYAFSIENFKRPKSELDFIFNLMESKFELFINNLDYYLRQGARFTVIGDISLLPKNLQVVISKLMLATKECNVVQINIAISYTSREEICSTIKTVVNGVENNEIDVHDIDETFFSRCLYTRENPDVDLILRTSGETRLSDFLLWQSTSSKLQFVQTLWPEITLWEIIYQIIHYQRMMLREPALKDVNKINSNPIGMKNYDQFSKNQSFLDKLTTQADQKLNYILNFDL